MKENLELNDFNYIVSDEDSWTCGCLYKCNDCIKLEETGESKRDYFERKDLD
jgi:hypothetical protein